MRCLLLFAGVLFAFTGCDTRCEIVEKTEEYWEILKKTERLVIEKVPIWEDYARHGVEGELRKYLLPYHLAQTKPDMALRTGQDLEQQIRNQELVALDGEQRGWFFYNVAAQYRYARPEVLRALQDIEAAIAGKLKEIDIDAVLKFAISSAVRPVNYQQNLRSHNENAAIISSHSYGMSVDIFYDEFFLSVSPPNGTEETQKYLSRMRTRTGFLYGAALRRQFRTLLTEALLELQRQGRIYVILEKNQRCYHITPVVYRK